MRGQEFKVRDKKVQKMTRDGLKEKNLSQGTEQRISSREAEVSFGQNRQTDITAGNRSQVHIQETERGQKQAHNQVQNSPSPYQQPETVSEQPEAADRFADAVVPEIWGPANAPPSMREAADVPMFHEQPHLPVEENAQGDTDATQEPAGKHLPSSTGQKHIPHMTATLSGSDRKTGFIAESRSIQQTGFAVESGSDRQTGFTAESGGGQQTGFTTESGTGRKTQAAARRHFEAGTAIPAKDMESESIQENGTPLLHGTGRLQFKPEERHGKPEKDKAEFKKKLAVKFSADLEKTADDSLPESDTEPGESGRLRFGHEERKETDRKTLVAVKKKHARRFAADMAKSEQKTIEKNSKKSPVLQEPGRLRFEHEDKKKEPSSNRVKEKKKPTGNQVQKKKKFAEKFSLKEKRPESASRLQYDRSERPPEERKEVEAAKAHAPEPDHAHGNFRQLKKYETAQHKVEMAGKKLEKAQSKLPTRRRIYLQKQYDSSSGKVKHRLQFETEAVPEYEKPPLPKRARTALRRTITTTAVFKLHQKIRETERDNVGVEAAHKAEFIAERGGGRFLRWNKRRLHEKPYREVRRAEKRLAKANVNANVNAAYRKLLSDNPELQKKKALSKWIQKQKLKRKYAAAAREAAKGAKHTTNVLTTVGQVIRAMVQKIVAHKAVLGIVAMGVLILALSGSLLSSCSAMLTGIQSAVVSTCYTAEDTEIEQSELHYTELETDLQRDIDSTETNNPGYDEYRYNIGEIGHNPYELMGYLSAAYGDFTYARVGTELNRLFGQQYQLTRTRIVETRTYTDDEGDEHEYEWYVLQTTLTVRPLSGIITSSLTQAGQTDHYGVYMQTCGNRQCYGNPFDFSWISYVTSPYGYRTHPATGAKDLHRGIDIGVAAGTPIKAVQDGRVISAGNNEDYGLCVVIEGADGYQSKYAHCASLSVSAGQEVKQGDTIATVGNTGNTTGAQLHLEVSHNGQYLNPYYYVDNGGYEYLPGGGAAGLPDFPADPGAAMGDGSYEAMLAEAQKYLGFPYVWGGSSPSTSFDCSGYVSWVINHSGVGSVGRQTAQGLYNLCTPVSRSNMQPGDLVFFTGTYSAATPVTHVGIYVGGGRMIHCGNPISYANIDSSYWASHFYSGGRLP